VIVVTNQAGVARGYFSEARVAEVHTHLDALLAQQGAHIDGYYYCPHHPSKGIGAYECACQCRKPRPGMLIRAADEFGLSLPHSYLVGDKVSDLQAARAAGCEAMLVKTGYGQVVCGELSQHGLGEIVVVENLIGAVDLCLASLTKRQHAA
jgi:D-glycero-D-manno-heptose 1,7-bisphosphate phosphatase